MSEPAVVESVDAALEKVARLDRLCCDPGRSPRLGRLREIVHAARIHAVEGDTDAMTEDLEAAGALLGELQVACCAPARMPLYAGALEDLSAARRAADPMH